ncbi:MAG: ABC transporter permease [Cyanobacteria bacterium]|nr:ABC transporter permease [Cyanobacteriota bacterium]
MPFELQVALRYLLAKRRQVFISVISLVSTLGVTVGVMALVIALAMMTGLQGELQSRILGSSAHVFVYKPAGITDYREEISKLSKVPGVIGAAPAVIGKALIRGLGQDGFVGVKGIDPAMEPSVTDIGHAMVEGSLSGLTPATEDDLPGIVLGKDLATDVGVKVGDTVSLLTANGTLSPMGVMPRQRRFKVVGLFRLGLYEVDAGSGFVDLERGMLLAGTDRVEHIEVKVAQIYDAPRIADHIAGEFGQDYVTQDWTDINRQLYSALLLEKIGMGIGIGLIVAVAALNIVASLILLVMEKTRDIAILKTMGASSKSITLIFLLQGTIIGVIGTIIGAVSGAALAYVLDRYRLITIPGDIYQVSYLPFKLLPGDFVAVVIGAVIVCFAATLYPSRQAAKLDPAQALRYE